MPKLNKQIKKHLLYALAMLMVFIGGLLGLDKINTIVEKDIDNYKAEYEAQKIQLEEFKATNATSCP